MKADQILNDGIIRLGSGLASKRGVGNKGALLDRAAKARLNVPSGIILLDTIWHRVIQTRIACFESRSVPPFGLSRFVAELRLPPFNGPIAVRSAFSAEDGEADSLAGAFTSRLFIDAADQERLAAALGEVWSSSSRYSETIRRDVLLMEMVQARYSGVAFTEREFEDDLVNYTTGVAEALVSGGVSGERLQLPKGRFWDRRRNTARLPSFTARLQRLLRDVRRVFGEKDWDIEWADDGDRCWLIQIRPITRPTRRNEAFTTANLKEILPELPSRFMTSVISSCADKLFDYFRALDPRLAAQRPLVEIFHGRPAFNLSLLTETMRKWGLPTRLIVDGMGGEIHDDSDFRFGRFCANAWVFCRMTISQLRSVDTAERTIRTLLKRTEDPGETFDDVIDTLLWLYTVFVVQMFSLVAAMSGPLMVLRKMGLLAEHHSRQRTMASQMFADLEKLRALVVGSEPIRTDIESGRLPSDPVFLAAWRVFLERHGHRGVYETDIARPRYREDPWSLLENLMAPPAIHGSIPRRSLAGLLTLPIWWLASRAIRKREELRYFAMLGFARIRSVLHTLAADAVTQGVLPSQGTLWMLEIEEIRRLDKGWDLTTDFLERRVQEIEKDRAYKLPVLFHRFDDLEPRARNNRAQSSHALHLSGVSLTTGEVEGQAWVIAEPQTTLPTGFAPQTTVLVAPSVDAGWISTFGCVSGVVVETGGDLSHGSIILREIGIPAVTNVKGATKALNTGDRLRLQAGAGIVRLAGS